MAPLRDRPGSLRGCARTSSGVPSAILRPKFSATTLSEMLITRLMWCSTSSTVVRRRSRMSRISRPSALTSSWLRPAAGSSSSSSFGSLASARASSTRFCIGNGSAATGVSASASRPTKWTSSRARSVVARSSRGDAGQAQRVGEEAARGAAMAADHHVVEHAHLREQGDVLERAADAERGDAMARHARAAAGRRR